MSTGLVICEICLREVHQTGPINKKGNREWVHCEDKTLASTCSPSRVRYGSKEEVKGKACFKDTTELNLNTKNERLKTI